MKNNIPQEGEINYAITPPEPHEFSPLDNKIQCSKCFFLESADCHTPKDTLRERFRELLGGETDIMFDGNNKPLCSAQAILKFIQSEISGAEEQERERIKGILEGMKIKVKRGDENDIAQERNTLLSEAIKKIGE